MDICTQRVYCKIEHMSDSQDSCGNEYLYNERHLKHGTQFIHYRSDYAGGQPEGDKP